MNLDANFNGFVLPTQKVPITLFGVAAYFPKIVGTPISFGFEVGYDPKIVHNLDLGILQTELKLRAVGANAVMNYELFAPQIGRDLRFVSSGLIAGTLIAAGEKLAINDLEQNYVLQVNGGILTALNWKGFSVGHTVTYGNIASAVLAQKNPNIWGWGSKLSATLPVGRTGFVMQGNYALYNESAESLYSVRVFYAIR